MSTDPVDQISRICDDADGDKLARIAVIVGAPVAPVTSERESKPWIDAEDGSGSYQEVWSYTTIEPITSPVASERVAIPTNADQAALMCLLGRQYLEQYAPERLVAPVASEPMMALANQIDRMIQQYGHPDYSWPEFRDGLLHIGAQLRAYSRAPRRLCSKE